MVASVRDKQYEDFHETHVESNLLMLVDREHLKVTKPFYLTSNGIAPYHFNPTSLLNDQLGRRNAVGSVKAHINALNRTGRFNLGAKVQGIAGRLEDLWFFGPVAEGLSLDPVIVNPNGSIDGNYNSGKVVAFETVYGEGRLLELLNGRGVGPIGAMAYLDGGEPNGHTTIVSLDDSAWELLRGKERITGEKFENVKAYRQSPQAWKAMVLESPRSRELMEDYLANSQTREMMERVQREFAYPEGTHDPKFNYSD